MSIKIRNFFIKQSRLVILVLLVIFFSATTTTFWTPTNWDNIANIILQQAPFFIILAIVMTIAIMLNGFDLSMGAGVALISCVMGMVLNSTYNSLLGIVVALLMGVVIGLFNGLLIAKIKVPPFIATYSMQWVLRGLALVLLGGRQIYDFGPTFIPLFTSSKYTFFIIAAVVVGIMGFLLKKTNFGKSMYASGTNIKAARLSGINTEKVIIIGWLINGFLVALVAIMYTANLSAAEPDIGESFPINAVAATLIGGTTIEGGSGRVSNAVIGSFILLALTNGMVQIGVPGVWQQFVIGIVIILAVILERGMEKISVKTE